MRTTLIILLLSATGLSFGQVYLTKSRICLLKGTWVAEQNTKSCWAFYDSTMVSIYRKDSFPSYYFIVNDTLELKSADKGLLKYNVLNLTSQTLSVMGLDDWNIYVYRRKFKKAK